MIDCRDISRFYDYLAAHCALCALGVSAGGTCRLFCFNIYNYRMVFWFNIFGCLENFTADGAFSTGCFAVLCACGFDCGNFFFCMTELCENFRYFFFAANSADLILFAVGSACGYVPLRLLFRVRCSIRRKSRSGRPPWNRRLCKWLLPRQRLQTYV